jgi:hypothetical protein
VAAGWTPEDHLHHAANRVETRAPISEYEAALRRAIMLLAESGEARLAPVIALLEREIERELSR